MSNSAHQITRDFERAVAEYTGAKYVVAVNSCTMAILLAVKWQLTKYVITSDQPIRHMVSIPKRTYVSVPQSIIHAGCKPCYREENWSGEYQLIPMPVWDSARRFTSGMYRHGMMQCVSFHTSKILGDSQGGAILLDDAEADAWLRRARFDGRTEGWAPADEIFNMVGYHCYLSPDVAARLLWKLSVLPKHNADLPNDNYPDLSLIKAFQ